jgi:hypothetical protein
VGVVAPVWLSHLVRGAPGATPGFPVGLGGITELDAAFLEESAYVAIGRAPQ